MLRKDLHIFNNIRKEIEEMRKIALLTALLLVVLGAVPVLSNAISPAPAPLPLPGGNLPGAAGQTTPAAPGQPLPLPGGNLPGAAGQATPAAPGQPLPLPGGNLPGAAGTLTK
jgi:hypothetical protein